MRWQCQLAVLVLDAPRAKVRETRWRLAPPGYNPPSEDAITGNIRAQSYPRGTHVSIREKVPGSALYNQPGRSVIGLEVEEFQSTRPQGATGRLASMAK